MQPRFRWLFALLLLGGCGVDLSYPDGVRVLCANDAQCSGNDAKCSLAAGVCVAADDPDVSPEITSVTATDSFHVVVVFSIPMPREQLAKLTNYSINHRVGISGIAIGDENTRVTLTTSLQRGRGYVLSTQALTDTLGRPLVAVEAAFEGVGDPVDGAGPLTLSPSDRSRVVQRQVDFAWTANVDAESYTLEVARDPGFVEIVERRDDLVDPNVTVIFAEDDTLYWRVKADVSAFSQVAVLGVVQDGMHVLCPADAASCTEDLTAFRGGDAAHPLVDPVYAIALARTIGASTVRVAQRDEANTPYDRALVLSGATFALEGGYDASFGQRSASARTAVRAPQTALRVSGSGITVGGFGLSGGTLSAPTVVLAGGTGNTLRDVDIMAADHEAMPLRVASTIDARLVNVRVDGVTDAAMGYDSELDSADVAIEHSHFATRGLTVTGVSSAEMVDSVVTATAVTLPAAELTQVDHAVLVEARASLTLVRTSVSVDATHDGKDIRAVIVDGGSLRAEASRMFATRVTGTCPFGCSPLILHASFAAIALADTLLFGSGTPARIDQELATTKHFVAINSTFASDVEAPGINADVSDGSGEPAHIVLMNDLFVVADNASMACVSSIDGHPVVVANNAFMGCANPVSDFDTIDALNLGGVTYGGNLAPSETAATLFPNRAGPDLVLGTVDDDFTPRAGTSIAGVGRSSITWVTTPAPLTYSARPTDLAERTHASPPSIGALEPR